MFLFAQNASIAALKTLIFAPTTLVAITPHKQYSRYLKSHMKVKSIFVGLAFVILKEEKVPATDMRP
jgi:hypothetical protein